MPRVNLEQPSESDIEERIGLELEQAINYAIAEGTLTFRNLANANIFGALDDILKEQGKPNYEVVDIDKVTPSALKIKVRKRDA